MELFSPAQKLTCKRSRSSVSRSTGFTKFLDYLMGAKYHFEKRYLPAAQVMTEVAEWVCRGEVTKFDSGGVVYA